MEADRLGISLDDGLSKYSYKKHGLCHIFRDCTLGRGCYQAVFVDLFFSVYTRENVFKHEVVESCKTTLQKKGKDS
jgi:hypothetical protein